MNNILSRSAALVALLLFCLPAFAQRTKFESGGEAYAFAEDLALIDAAVARDIVGVPPDDRGQIVFFRSVRSDGDSLAVSEQSGRELARLPSASYFIVTVPPGAHAYAVGPGDGLMLNVRPGRTHYVQVSSGQHPRLLRANSLGFLDAATGKRRPIL